jgi:hypothetical protein
MNRLSLGVAMTLTLTAGTACTAEPVENLTPEVPVSAPSATGAAAAELNAEVVAAALPTDADVPGYTRLTQQPATFVRLCPSITETFDGPEVHASGTWRNDSGAVYVVTVLDPENAPVDELLSKLAPSTCPERDGNGTKYLHDKQPFTRAGWTGDVNKSLVTPIAGGQYYVVSYLLSKGDALVNVIVDGTLAPGTTGNPAVDETAESQVELVLDRFPA